MRRCATISPLAHHRDVVGHRHDLAQLVGDQDDRLALVAQRAQDAEQVVGLLRGQHAGRLVEDQDAAPRYSALRISTRCWTPDRQVGDDGVEIDLEAVFPLEPRDLVRGRGRRPRPSVSAALGAEQHVLQHREGVDQHEMLVDHADAGRDRVLRAVDLAVLPSTWIVPRSAW